MEENSSGGLLVFKGQKGLKFAVMTMILPV